MSRLEAVRTDMDSSLFLLDLMLKGCVFFLTLHLFPLPNQLPCWLQDPGPDAKAATSRGLFSQFPQLYQIQMCVCVCVCVCVQLCLTLCNPMDYSLPGSSAHGILQARILEWIVISSSRGSSQPKVWIRVSCGSCTVRQILYHCATWA